MAHTPRKQRKLPKDIAQRSDHDIMEKVFGKRIMKEVDKLVSERSQDTENK